MLSTSYQRIITKRTNIHKIAMFIIRSYCCSKNLVRLILWLGKPSIIIKVTLLPYYLFVLVVVEQHSIRDCYLFVLVSSLCLPNSQNWSNWLLLFLMCFVLSLHICSTNIYISVSVSSVKSVIECSLLHNVFDIPTESWPLHDIYFE